MAKKHKPKNPPPVDLHDSSTEIVGRPEAPVPTPGTPEAVGGVILPPPAKPQFDVTAQVSGAWNSLLAMTTQQGATRGDIIGMALETSGAILAMTAQALWPEGSDLPTEELQAFGAFQGCVHTITEAKEALGL